MLITIAELTSIAPAMFTTPDLIEKFATSINFYMKVVCQKQPLIQVE